MVNIEPVSFHFQSWEIKICVGFSIPELIFEEVMRKYMENRENSTSN